MKITDVSEQYGNTQENEATVEVTIDDNVFVIQLVDGKYRPDLGCQFWLNDEHEPDITGDESMFNDVVKAVEAQAC